MKRVTGILLGITLLFLGGCSKQVLLHPSEMKRPVVLADLNIQLRNFAQDPFETDDPSVLLLSMWQNYNSNLTLNQLHDQLDPSLNKKVTSRLDSVVTITRYDLAKANLKLLPTPSLKGLSRFDDYGFPDAYHLKTVAAKSGHASLRLSVYLSANHLDTQQLAPGDVQITYRPEAVIAVKLVNPEGHTIWSASTDEMSPQLMQIEDQYNGGTHFLTIDQGPNLPGLVNQGLTSLLRGLPAAVSGGLS